MPDQNQLKIGKIFLDGKNGSITSGALGGSGVLKLLDSAASESVLISAESPTAMAQPIAVKGIIKLGQGQYEAEGSNKGGGKVTLKNSALKSTVSLDGENGRARLGDSGVDGAVSVIGANGAPAVELLALPKESVIGAGTANRPGRLTLYNGNGQQTVNITTADAKFSLGGGGVAGSISVFWADGKPSVELLARINESVIAAGQVNRPGRLTMYNGSGQQTVNLSTTDAKFSLGGGGVNGSLSVLAADGSPLIELLGKKDECVIGLGQSNRPGRISIYNGGQNEAIRLDGVSGDILLMNADCAEEFDVSESDVEVEPGTVMVLDENGALRPSSSAFDRRVAGVVSGAGKYKPGIVLDRQVSTKPRLPIALVGKVYCNVDASFGAVRVGDLLTTSDTLGHAMRADDPLKAFGAVLGKALRPLASGQEMIPILVALQ
ncbi:MAG: hypothetical protein JNK38_09130 [Acidobacteria bacterium]|nr:hypothetical protein [Acidobacteriota bacterium]